MRSVGVDFSWVKQLAEDTNQQELARQEQIKRQKEERKVVAQATIPFVEKLHLVINGASEEFNKHCQFPNMKINITRMYKHSKTGAESDAEPDEVAYFTFQRLSQMYGICGINGTVEFVSTPVGEMIGANIKLHEHALPAVKRLVAEVDPESRKTRWLLDGVAMDGAGIVSLCQKFFINLIEVTNAEYAQKDEPSSYQHH
jgi:hypothetical protein